MTAITAPRSLGRATSFERMLLRTAAVLDGFVAARLAHRASEIHRAAVDVQASFAAVRRAAEARAAIGILPR